MAKFTLTADKKLTANDPYLGVQFESNAQTIQVDCPTTMAGLTVESSSVYLVLEGFPIIPPTSHSTSGSVISYIFPLTSEYTQKAGTLSVQIVVTTGTGPKEIVVRSELAYGSMIRSEDVGDELSSLYPSVIDEANKAASAAQQEAEDAASSAEAALTSQNAAKTSETNAASSASSALLSKNAAATSETNALASADRAQQIETDAEAAESARISAENTRQSNEATRQTNESTRTTNENERVSAESARAFIEDYNANTSYVVGNKAALNGNTYQCKSPCKGITPPNTTYWILISSKGDSGVYVGSGDMPEGYNIQIDPNGGDFSLGALITSGAGYAIDNGSTRPTLGDKAVDESYTTNNTYGATGKYSHAECENNTASGRAAHAEGILTTASGDVAHTEGVLTTASGEAAHAEGGSVTASGRAAHAEGLCTTASGWAAHAEGLGTTASCDAQHVSGRANIIDTTSLEIVGNGAVDVDTGNALIRSNARTLDASGNGWFAGKVSAGTEWEPATPTAPNDLTPKQYVDESISELANNLNGTEIYGAYWNKGSDPTLTRLNCARNAVVNLGTDAIMALNEFDTSSLFSEFSEVTDDYDNVFIRIPRIYIKKVDTVGYKAWYVSRYPFTGAYLPKCFWDFTNNKELDYVDVGAYNASSADGISLDSKSGTYPLIGKTIVQMRTMAQENGAEYQQLDVHVVDLLQTLFVIEQATINSQSKVAGYTSGQYSATHTATVAETAVNRIIVATATAALYEVGQAISIGTSLGDNQIFYGRTITAKTVIDASNTAIEFDGTAVNIAVGNMLYNTGAKSGFSANISASVGSVTSNTIGKTPFVWHGIENLFGSIYQFVDGVNINERQAWVCPDAASYASNLFTAPYEQLSYVNGAADGYIKEMGYDSAHPYASFPAAVGGSSSTYYGDYYYQSTGQCVALLGGNWLIGSGAGLFCWSLDTSSSDASSAVGGRLVRKASQGMDDYDGPIPGLGETGRSSS